MPIPDRPLSREEARKLTDTDVKAMGFETEFWPFYFRVFWSVAKGGLLLLVINLVLGYGASLVSASDYKISPVLSKALPLFGVAVLSPFILLVISHLWWHGSAAIDSLFGKHERRR